MRALVDDDGASLRVIDGVAIGILGLVALAGFATSYGTIAPLVGMIGMVPSWCGRQSQSLAIGLPGAFSLRAIVVYLAVRGSRGDALDVNPVRHRHRMVRCACDSTAHRPLGDLLAVPLACGVVIAAVSPRWFSGGRRYARRGSAVTGRIHRCDLRGH